MFLSWLKLTERDPMKKSTPPGQRFIHTKISAYMIFFFKCTLVECHYIVSVFSSSRLSHQSRVLPIKKSPQSAVSSLWLDLSWYAAKCPFQIWLQLVTLAPHVPWLDHVGILFVLLVWAPSLCRFAELRSYHQSAIQVAKHWLCLSFIRLFALLKVCIVLD